MKIEDYEIVNDEIEIVFDNDDLIYIKKESFESWLSDKGYMTGCNVSPDHNGEPMESAYEFAGFEEWSADKTPDEVIKFIEEYLNEQKLFNFTNLAR